MRVAQVRCGCGEILNIELKGYSKLTAKVAKLICQCGARLVVQYKKKDEKKVLVNIIKYEPPQEKPKGIWVRLKFWLLDKLVKSLKKQPKIQNTIKESSNGHEHEDAPRGA